MYGIITVGAMMLLWMLPGALMWLRFVCCERSLENVINSFSFGFGVLVVGVYLLSMDSLQTALVVWTVLSVCVALYFLWLRQKRSSAKISCESETKWMWMLIGVTLVLRFFPVFFYEYPRGWDPYSHLLLIQEILLGNGQVYSWLPYENIPLHYPIGTHLLVAMLAKACQLVPHVAFNLCLIWSSIFTILLVYSLGVAASLRRDLALFAASAYALLAIMGSAGYFSWGGLPNMHAVCLLTGALTCYISLRDVHKLVPILPVFFVGICLFNEHALLSAMLTFLCIGVRSLCQAEEKSRGVALAKAGVISMIIGVGYYLFLNAGHYSYKETGFLRYREDLYTPNYLMNTIGPVYLFMAIMGAFLCYANRERFGVNRTLLLSIIMLACFFALLEYLGRLATWVFWEESFAPLAPARFLTDDITLMAVLVGVFLMKFKEVAQVGTHSVMILVLVFATSNHWLYATFLEPQIDANKLPAYQWIREHTPDDTMVIDTERYAAYFCRRPTMHTPLGSSELWSQANNRTYLYSVREVLASGKIPKLDETKPLVIILPKDVVNSYFEHFEKIKPGFLQPVWADKDEKFYIFMVGGRHLKVLDKN